MDEIRFTAKVVVIRGTVVIMQTMMDGKPVEFELPLSRLPVEADEVEITVRKKDG